MGKSLLLLILLICSGIASAATTQLGTIRLTVENSPPSIKSVAIGPQIAYEDSVLECEAEAYDESPSRVRFTYIWLVNGIAKDDHDNHLTGLRAGDIVECQATPIDMYGEQGKTGIAETNITAASVQATILKRVFSAAGVTTELSKIENDANMEAVTGMVTGKKGSGITLFYLLGIFCIILLLVNAFGIAFHKFYRNNTL